MKKEKKRFVLAEASLEEIGKHLKVNTLMVAMLIVMIGLNTVHFMREYSVLYGALIAIMVFLLFVMLKSRKLLKDKKQVLSR